MIIIFYEILDGHRNPVYVRYPVDRKRFNLKDDYFGPTLMVYRARKIWEWNTETNTVRYVKNTNKDLVSKEADSKEFTLVKLAAVDFQGKMLWN